MRNAGRDAHYEAGNRINEPDSYRPGGFANRHVRATHVYKAMLAAAPSVEPPAVELPAWPWRLIADEKPPEGVPVWLADVEAGDIWCGTFEFEDEGWNFTNTYGQHFYFDGWKTDTAEWDDDYKPTHWMPLPPLPAAIVEAKENP
jgi:hypothetical protein